MAAHELDIGVPRRVVAIDIARFIALAGMFAAHTWNRNDDGSHTLIGELVDGRAAALFAVLAGVGITFVTRRDLAAGRTSRARGLLLGRGAALLVIGLSLGLLGSNIFVIIAYYGLLFWALVPLINLRTRWLAVIALTLTLFGPPLNVLTRTLLGVEYEVGTPTWFDLLNIGVLFRALLLTGIYPAITWAVYGIVGILIGRALARAGQAHARRALGGRLALTGIVAALLGGAGSYVTLFVLGGHEALAEDYGQNGEPIVDALLNDSGTGAPLAGNPYWLAAALPHTGTVTDILITAGIACAVIGLCLVAFAAPNRMRGVALIPIAGAGAAPLTVYSVHVFLSVLIPGIAIASGASSSAFSSSAGLYVVHLLVALAIGTSLTLLHSRGPFESLVTATGNLVAGRRSHDDAVHPGSTP